jgi:hypothetical protein
MITDQELIFIKNAFDFLEKPSFITKVTDYVGKPVEMTVNKLPQKVQKKLVTVSELALRKSLIMANKTLADKTSQSEISKKLKSGKVSRVGHNLATFTTGAIGGFFGGIGAIIELPITTTLIMRSILSQGQTYGNLTKEELITNALYIFSLGSNRSSDDDDMNSAYYSSRIAMELTLKRATEYMASHSPGHVLKSIEAGSAPFVLELITKVATRFNVTVSEKIIAESIPVLGAGAGATLNLLFTDFFTLSAKYHFGLMSLEQKYGKEEVRRIYNESKLETS